MILEPSGSAPALLTRDRHINLATLVAFAASTLVVLVAGIDDVRAVAASVLLVAVGIEWLVLRMRTRPWRGSRYVTGLIALATLPIVWIGGVPSFHWVTFSALLLFVRFEARRALFGAALMLVAALALLEASDRADHFTIGRLAILGLAVISVAYITARSVARVESSLDETAQLLRDTITSVSQGIVVIAPDGRIRYLNQRAVELIALPPEMVRDDLSIRDIFLLLWQRGEIAAELPHARGFTPAMLNDWPALRRLLLPSHVRPLADGRWVEVRTHETPTGDLVRTLTDVTRFHEAQAKAQAASEAKAKFLANMSHELRTPMSAILGLSGLALESDLTPRQREWMRKIDASGRQLLTMVDGILEAAEPDTSPDLASRPTFVVAAAVQSATVPAMREAQAKGLTFAVDVAPDVPRDLVGDGRQFAQLLRHLVANAVKFTTEGGIEVRVRAEQVSPRASRLRVTVTDTGVGVAPAERERLFDAFEQGDASAARAFGGSGIGLALAKRLAQRLDGELGVESAPGQGSTFWFTAQFPVVADAWTAPPAVVAPRVAAPVVPATSAAETAAASARATTVSDEHRRPSEAQARVVQLMRQLGEARARLAETPSRILVLATGISGLVALVVAFAYAVWLAFGGAGAQGLGYLAAPVAMGLSLSLISWRARERRTLPEGERLLFGAGLVLLYAVSMYVNGYPAIVMMAAWVVALYATMPAPVARGFTAAILLVGLASAVTTDVSFELVLRAFAATVIVLVLMEALVPSLGRSVGTLAAATQALEEVSDELVTENQRLAVTSAAAEEAARTKSSAVASVSHEIRTPVNAILGLSQVMLQGELTAKQRERLRKIEDSGHHLLALVNHVLDLSRLEAGKFQLDLAPLALRPLLDRVRDAVGVDRVGKPVTFGIEVASDVPAAVIGDRLRLTQVLLNYLSNAVKYTERGRITVRVRCEPGVVEASDRDAVQLRIEVEDTGVGIDAAQQARLFLPFEQVQEAARQRAGGAGLGLSISRWLVERMGGTVGVESRPGVGSTFWFTVRVRSAADAMDGATAADAVRLSLLARRGARVLVVDDNDINREVAGSLLRNAGLVIREAESGPRALALAAEEAFDLVLMDLHMPGMDGFEVTRRLRLDPRAAEVPIVALTANALPDVRQRCLDAGMNDYLAKPFNQSDLGALVVRWVPPVDREVEAVPADETVATPPEPPVARSSMESAAVAMPVPDLAGLIPVARGLDTEDGLRRFLGDHALYLSLLARFVDAYGGSIDEIADAMRRGDREHAELRAHTVKGVAATLGAAGLAQACARLESAIRGDATASLLAGALQDARDKLDPLVADLRTGLDLEMARGLDAEPSEGAAGDGSLDELDELLRSSDPESRDWAARNATSLATLAPENRTALLAALDRFDLGTALNELRAARR